MKGQTKENGAMRKLMSILSAAALLAAMFAVQATEVNAQTETWGRSEVAIVKCVERFDYAEPELW